MALSFPLTVANFWDLLPIQETDGLRLMRQDELGSQGSGGTIRKILADPLWCGNFTLKPLLHRAANDLIALMNAVDDAAGYFYAYDPIIKYPKNDPTGSIIGSSAVQINASSSPVLLQLKGLTAAYVISRGDLLQHTYSTTKNGFYQVVETVTADGSGVTGSFTIVPRIKSGWAVSDAISLKKPQFIAQFVPTTLTMTKDGLHTIIKFGICQV